ncbi:hypothetical protein [Paraburkholderia sp. ZP32-5]|uniref:hypothetical protein n=1 Tax=Paraburkholderia sp. ZP32-5 TaxID=2883245 RepID=UPI001F39D10F|nr:hypothetical protein [Paraburkholderia sp. ZP32-5]
MDVDTFDIDTAPRADQLADSHRALRGAIVRHRSTSFTRCGAPSVFSLQRFHAVSRQAACSCLLHTTQTVLRHAGNQPFNSTSIA